MDADSENRENSDSTFVWDHKSQLYFHASSGFYHDPNAGWYYSSRDGAYYKFEDGNYVLLDSNKDDNADTYLGKETTTESPQQISEGNDIEDYFSFLENRSETNQQTRILANEALDDGTNSVSSPTSERPPPPPSEWLEDTLIDLYLSGYKNIAVSEVDGVTVPLETDDGYNTLAADAYSKTYEVEGEWNPNQVGENGLADTKSIVDEGVAYNNSYELEEGEWIPDMEDECDIADRSTIDEGVLSDEEKWRAQYGQVTESGKDLVLEVPIVDLWDWEMVTRFKRDEKDKVARLVGRLVRPSAKQHPSIPSGGGKLRSAPICEAHLDLQIKHQYRDRAAERRILHGGFGMGPGQKNLPDVYNSPSSPDAGCPQEAASEALEMSFGAGSYARKLLKSMGWKEGEGLGSSTKGLVEPIQPVGNVGTAGLGWSR
ncbi:uncharacterized protein LOC106759793 isoform X3 [Vigna radiata var. radiata]|uniref:Uncharacterized protein LOC106759793 isoform X3 n=1 Tax=Vigna radiata var. radiata TaxID=3916 RepID=A0A3Q0F106_VIGRR|nr:uncharacterized protein LOC106759793 isoform X3 [Vigna radiata var. radiata]